MGQKKTFFYDFELNWWVGQVVKCTKSLNVFFLLVTPSLTGNDDEVLCGLLYWMEEKEAEPVFPKHHAPLP